SEERIYAYIGFLREAAEMVTPNPLLIAPIRDVNDTVVMQTALIGEADVLCTRDRDFFEPPAEAFLRKARGNSHGRHRSDSALARLTRDAGISVLTDPQRGRS